MADWEKNWRGSGIGAVLFFIVAYVIYGSQPKVGASPEQLVSFYDGDRTRIFIASVILGFAILNLLWFGAALTSVLRDAGKAGWGTAATTASAVLGGALSCIVPLTPGSNIIEAVVTDRAADKRIWFDGGMLFQSPAKDTR